MVRTMLALRAALTLAGVHDAATATSYAAILRAEGARRGIDPFAVVALIENESRWDASAVGGVGGQCIGLGQLCLHAIPACRGSDRGSAACSAERAALLDGPTNLRRVFGAIGAWKAHCTRHVRHVRVRHWLFGYQGYGAACGVGVRLLPATTRSVLRRYAEFRALERFAARQK